MNRTLARAMTLLSIAVSLLAAHPAGADSYLNDWHPYQTYWAVEWSAAVPVTGLRANFISDPGWMNGGFAARVGVVQRLALGVSGHWNWFSQTYPFVTVQEGDFTFTGPLYRRLSAFTVLATAHYYLTQSAVQPYVGVGAGGVFTTAVQQIVNRPTTTYVDGFAFTGEAGVLFTVVQRLGIYVSGRYQFNLATFAGTTNPCWVSAQVGAAYYF